VKSVTTKEESSRVSTTPVAPKIIIPLAQRLVQELVSSSTASLEVEELMRELATEVETDPEPVVDIDVDDKPRADEQSSNHNVIAHRSHPPHRNITVTA